jgi:hypothetical protein
MRRVWTTFRVANPRVYKSPKEAVIGCVPFRSSVSGCIDWVLLGLAWEQSARRDRDDQKVGNKARGRRQGKLHPAYHIWAISITVIMSPLNREVIDRL